MLQGNLEGKALLTLTAVTSANVSPGVNDLPTTEMATARAQAISGTGVRVKEYRSNGREVLTLNTPGSYERFLSEEDDEMPLTWLKRIVSRAIWTQRFFWVPATVLLLIDAMMTLIVVLAVKCACHRGCMTIAISEKHADSFHDGDGRHRDRLCNVYATGFGLCGWTERVPSHLR